jgi:hypothetical protein
MTFFIDLRADSAGGNPVATIDDIVVRTDVQPNPNPSQPLNPALIQAVQGRDVLLGTHGFNVNRTAGIDHLNHWNEWLNLGANGFFVAVLWPGDSRWIPVVDYPVEDSEAIKSGKLLAQFLIKNFVGVNSISFASHSLGARVILETVRNLGQTFTIKSLTMMAGAIDDDCLSNEYKAITKQMGRISVLASDEDEVLKLGFPIGNPLAGIISRGDPYWHGALGRFGPNPPNQPANLVGTPILPDSFRIGHGEYIGTTGQVVGPPGESGPFFPPAVVVPPQGTPPPSNALNWRQAYTAGFVSTRFGG